MITNNNFLIILCCVDPPEGAPVIRGLAQPDRNVLIYTDNRNHCLRKLETRSVRGARSWISSTLAGRCSKSGDVDGYKTLGRLHQPFECKHYQNFIFLTANWFKIKKINLLNESLTTIHESPEQRQLRFLELGTSPNEFYVTANHGVLHVMDGTETWLIESSSSMLNTDPNAIQFNKPMQIVWLNNDTLLVADTQTHTLKKVDVNLKKAETICNGMYALTVHTEKLSMFSNTSQTIYLKGVAT